MLKKALAGIFIIGLLLSWLKGWALIFLGVVALLILVRLLADVFWWGRDKGRW